MWVRVEDSFYNTDAIVSVERKTDASVYYMVRFADRSEAGFSEKQIKPLLDALSGLAAKSRQEQGEAAYEPHTDKDRRYETAHSPKENAP